MKQKLSTWFKWIGIAEGISFLVLLGIAMPLKYMANLPMAVSIVGMLHGILFMAYLYLVYECRNTYGWPLKMAAEGVLASIVPFGPFIFHRKVEKWSTQVAERG